MPSKKKKLRLYSCKKRNEKKQNKQTNATENITSLAEVKNGMTFFFFLNVALILRRRFLLQCGWVIFTHLMEPYIHLCLMLRLIQRKIQPQYTAAVVLVTLF